MLYIHRLACCFAFCAIFIRSVSSDEPIEADATGNANETRIEKNVPGETINNAETGSENTAPTAVGDDAQKNAEDSAPTEVEDNAETDQEEGEQKKDPHKEAGSSSLKLEGKMAVVTGGASGIGRSVSLVLAREGVTVMVADINDTGSDITIEMLKVIKPNLKHQAWHIDVRNSTHVDYLFECIGQLHPEKSISIVVNSAGILPNSAMVEYLEESIFDNVISTNLKGTFLVTRAAVRHMLLWNITDGAIVNVASILAKAGFPGISAYAASKGGVVSFTKSVALEVATRGIRVNAILPGLTNTPMITNYFVKEKLEILAKARPMRRMAEPIEISETIVFMCSSKASYMTGAAVDVAGGTYL